jgi:predicted permease
VIARLRGGVSVRSAKTEMNGIQGRLGRQFASLRVPDHVVVRGYGEKLTAHVRASVEALAAGVALVWLIACASVAGLLLTRFTQRRRELAVRVSLGATRRQLLGQMLSESLLLGLLAGGVGLALATVGLSTLARYVAARLPVPLAPHLSAAVLWALVGTTMLSVALIGTVPALLAAGGAGLAGLRGSADVAGGRGQRRLHDALVVAEIALALALLVGAGLMLRTLQALGRVPLGFTTDNVVSSSFLIPAGKFVKQNIETGFYQPVLERVERMPGVAAAAFTSVIPLSTHFSMTGSFGIVGQPDLSDDQKPQGQLRISSPEYPQALGVGIARGRFFDARIDTLASPRVVVINQAMARRYFAGTDPIGKQLAMGKKGPWAATTIIGVLDDVHETGIAAPPPPTMHFSTTQLQPGDLLYGVGSMFTALVVRGKVAPSGLVTGLRSVLQETAPEIGVKNFVSMRQVVATSISGQTLAARLVAIFAAAALAIALAGLYGLLSYAVSQRTREIGIRMALGAERRAILRLVLGRAGVLLTVGIAGGIGLALAGAVLLRGFLYGVPARDPGTLAAVAVMLAACGLAAAYLPARRAADTSPLTALRAE